MALVRHGGDAYVDAFCVRQTPPQPTQLAPHGPLRGPLPHVAHWSCQLVRGRFFELTRRRASVGTCIQAYGMQGWRARLRDVQYLARNCSFGRLSSRGSG
eukprot:8177635-Pyramimonas_sp.AAC.1